MSQEISIVKAVPVLEVANVGASMVWYREVLGFVADPFPESPPHKFAMLLHGETELMLRSGISKATPGQRQYNWDIYLRLGGSQIRKLYDDLNHRGIVTRRLERMFYGLAEFEIKDPDGYILCLAEELAEMKDLPTPEF